MWIFALTYQTKYFNALIHYSLIYQTIIQCFSLFKLTKPTLTAM